ncbi:MAG: pirin family protein [Deltaproteobacteria bacterium]|nr:pirin family protein [Deltaproteobacteria bacterium]
MNPIRQVAPLRSPPWPTLDPFLFCVHHDDRYPAGNDQMGPASSLAGRHIGSDFSSRDGWSMYHGRDVPGFPAHPHRGFETVTLARRGRIDHSDSLGATARFGDGDVQWMTAGRGVVHSEMFPLLRRDGDNHAELFQIWLNLPRESKMVAPYFTMLWADSIPVIEREGARVTVVAGRFDGITGPGTPPDSWAADPAHEVGIWTIALAPGGRVELALSRPDINRALYAWQGVIEVNGQAVAPGQLLALRADVATTLSAAAGAEVLVLQGQPIGEPVAAHGPFVMNTASEIHQAYADYQRTRFGGWPFARPDPVHPREQGRFARHADGRVEERR